MKAAVVIPVYRESLLDEERPALVHLRQHLSEFPWFQVSPEGLALQVPRAERLDFARQHFRSVEDYSRLLLSESFYTSFANFDYILVYQLDCLVFEPNLLEWCEKGYDYIGAPLFRKKGQWRSGFSGALNGGLSLRNVKAFLKVLQSDDKRSILKDCAHRRFTDVHEASLVGTLIKRARVARSLAVGARRYAASYSLNEDLFWSTRATYFSSDFRIAPPEVALSFAFEAAPEFCYRRNANKLPFGAHAWKKWGNQFWSPYVLNN